MIYNTGTLSVSGNTATGAGTNFTAPASQIRVGQTLLVASSPVQLFQITAINSATSLTISPAASPALSGQKYAILVTDSLSVEGLAQSISQLINEYDENIGAWETFATTSANQSITVTINGSSVNIPALGALAKKGANSDITSLSGLTTPLSMKQGGLGASNPADARANLGLGSAAVLNDSEATGSVLKRGDGITDAIRGGELATMGFMMRVGFGSYRFDAVQTGLIQRYSTGLYGKVKDTHAFLQVNHSTATVTAVGALGTFDGGFTWASSTLYGTSNTTKASDGTLKAASPVARIINSREETERTDVCEEGFVWAGSGTANAEAEGINISRLDVGVYVLTGAAGLASEGWRLLPPRDPDGSGDLGIVEAQETESGGITVRLYKRRYVLSEEGDIELAKGAPIDVPANSWIDIRLDMPAESVWNQRQATAQEQMEETGPASQADQPDAQA